jgi:hypothetical protein
MENTKIEWAAVPGFPAYRLSSDGLLWTCWGRGGKRRLLTNMWRPVVPDVGKKGHRRVTLYAPGKRLRVLLHRLMLELFVGPCPDGMEACHGDGNPANNKLDNLRWDTPQGNWLDRRRHGRGCEGRKNASARLTEEEVRTIRRLKDAGCTLRQLADRFQVTTAAISLITTGKTWRHLDG